MSWQQADPPRFTPEFLALPETRAAIRQIKAALRPINEAIEARLRAEAEAARQAPPPARTDDAA